MSKLYINWIISISLYIYQYILRISPNVMNEQIITKYSLNADQFASLGSLYFITYAVLQLPMGRIMDSVGVKRVMLFSITVCFISSLIFPFIENFALTQLTRSLMGVGSAAALLCSLKIIADNFDNRQKSVLMGITLASGTLAAFVIGNLLITLMGAIGWINVCHLISLLGFIILIFIFFMKDSNQQLATPQSTQQPNGDGSFSEESTKLVRNDNDNDDDKSSISSIIQDFYKSFVSIISNRYIMMYALFSINAYAPVAVFANLWGTSFLAAKFQLNNEIASHLSLYMYPGLTAGSIILPALCRTYKHLKYSIIFSVISTLSIIMVLVWSQHISNINIAILMTAMGFFCGAEVMCFSAAIRFSNKSNTGEIMGMVNAVNILFSALFQQIIGFIIRQTWNGTSNIDGTPIYTASNYVSAFNVMIATMLISITFCIFLNKGGDKHIK